MKIWTYRGLDMRPRPGNILVCEFCREPLTQLPSRYAPDHVSTSRERSYVVSVCPMCGWWVFTHSLVNDGQLGWERETSRAAGQLLALDGSAIDAPTEELSRHLLRSYADRFWVHPKKYEDIVASVFCSAGFNARVTSFAGDEGIDMFVFDGPADSVIGVQVKRYRGKIEAEQIRSFVGALVIAGLTRGIFVTTSGFRAGATRTAAVATAQGTPVELWDAGRFYDALEITRRTIYEFAEDSTAPYYALLLDHRGMSLLSRTDGWYEV